MKNIVRENIVKQCFISRKFVLSLNRICGSEGQVQIFKFNEKLCYIVFPRMYSKIS